MRGPRSQAISGHRRDATVLRLFTGLLLAGLLIGGLVLLALAVRLELPSTGRRTSSLPWHEGRDEQRLAGGEPAAQPCVFPGSSSGTSDTGGGKSLNPPVEPGPRHCWLGLPDESAVALDFGPGDGDDAASGAAAGTGAATRVPLHRLAVLIPYRDREEHLTTLLAALVPYLERQHRDFDIFVLEQGDGYLFNRGALLNAGVLLLQGSAYDHFVFQDVDTIPLDRETGGVQYRYPRGEAPLHLSPFGMHPKASYEDFFGGILIMTREQVQSVNGFAPHFWGWGREDDNMRERLLAAGLWPPQYPKVPSKFKGYYFKHQGHKQAEELRAQESKNGTLTFFQEQPDLPFRGAKIVSSQPQWLQDQASGLNTTRFRVLRASPVAGGAATKYTLALYCDQSLTPWCNPGAIAKRPGVRKPRFHKAAHAVASNI